MGLLDPLMERPREVLRLRPFALFWGATSLRAFGAAIAGVAFQVLIVTVLDASALEISILSALSVLPYLFLGLIVGALMDRWRRQRTLVITSIGRAIVLALVPVLLLLDALTVWSLGLIILALGVLILFAHSAEQPLLPRIVPRDSLVMANARLGQSDTVASTAGPALGGVLLNLIPSSSPSTRSSTPYRRSSNHGSLSTRRPRSRGLRAATSGTTSPRGCATPTDIGR